MPKLLKRYHEMLTENGWKADPFQEKAVHELQRLLSDLSKGKKFFSFFAAKEQVKGIYLYGGVGRGKSMLMELFLAEGRKKNFNIRRSHFHEFMIETHDWLHAHRGEGMDDLLPRYAQYVSKKTKILCFDEFHITDVADAMILGRLFTELFQRGLVVVATSNWAPDNLYEGGLQRDRFIPFINLLKEKTAIIHLDSDTDYRKISDSDQDVYYFYPLNTETEKKIGQLFDELTLGADVSNEKLLVKGHHVSIQSAGDVAQASFSDLCEKAYGAEDYIELAKRYDTLFLTDIPLLGYERRNEAKRFILLIDCLYEARCRLVISAEGAVDNLYQGKDHGFEFDRTISRLMEMQSIAYHEARQGSSYEMD